MQIDLNADLAEGYGPWRMGDDDALLDVAVVGQHRLRLSRGRSRSSWSRPSRPAWSAASISAPMWAFPTARASDGGRCRSTRTNSLPW